MCDALIECVAHVFTHQIMEGKFELSCFAMRLLVLPIIPIVFAYLELGGNWFAYRMLERATLDMVAGVLVFSTLYAFVAALVARFLQVDMALLMVNYGFGFSIVAMLLKLEWGRLPEFTGALLQGDPRLWLLLAVALIGFVISAIFVITSQPAKQL
jgi:hypothetical protein